MAAETEIAADAATSGVEVGVEVGGEAMVKEKRLRKQYKVLRVTGNCGYRAGAERLLATGYLAVGI